MKWAGRLCYCRCVSNLLTTGRETSTTAFLTGNRNDHWPHLINYQDNYADSKFTQSALTAPSAKHGICKCPKHVSWCRFCLIGQAPVSDGDILRLACQNHTSWDQCPVSGRWTSFNMTRVGARGHELPWVCSRTEHCVSTSYQSSQSHPILAKYNLREHACKISWLLTASDVQKIIFIKMTYRWHIPWRSKWQS